MKWDAVLQPRAPPAFQILVFAAFSTASYGESCWDEGLDKLGSPNEVDVGKGHLEIEREKLKT